MTNLAKVVVSLICIAGGTLVGDELQVTVSCTNGTGMANIVIQVTDSMGTTIPNVTKTDENGMFVIQNSEMYVAPFFMAFQSNDGSTCGPYPIITFSGQGRVDLNYYPTILPCSCSHF